MMKKNRFIGALAVLAGVLGIFGLAACDFSGRNDNVGDDPANSDAAIAVYNQAVDLGYTGTLEEFLALVKGQDGKDGLDGKDGQDGKDGKDGQDGQNGKDGQDGLNGKDGKDGRDGVGIGSVTVNGNGELVITGTNGSVLFREKLPLCTHVFSEPTQGLAPTCTSAGYTYRECEKCGVKDYEAIPQTGHSYDEGTVIYEPDCVKNGLKYYTCLTCGDTKTEIIKATGEHVFENGDCIYCHIGLSTALDRKYNGNYGYEYFSSLPDGEKYCKLYNAIDAQVKRFHGDETADAELSGGNYLLPEINYAELGLTSDEAISVWKTYLDDKPLYYWISRGLSFTAQTLSVNVAEDYAEGETRAQYNEKLYELIEQYTQTATGEKSAYNIAFAYHDMIIDRIDYAYESDGRTPEDADWAHSIAGVFEEKGAVCEGYARAFQLLLNVRGVENVFVTGKGRRESHAWNLVRLDDGQWYWYDLTWDDTPTRYWGTSHNYFCATDESFLTNHTVDESTATGTEFLYELPVRAAKAYAGNEVKYGEVFTATDGTDYAVVGYNSLCLSEIRTGGDYVIPEEVLYRNRTFKVVGLRNYENGKPGSQSVLSFGIQFSSVHLPSTVRYIDDRALCGFGVCRLESITVAEDNPYFCARDGVLFTEGLYTLISYPAGNPRTSYAIPDETVWLANSAFQSVSKLALASLHIGKSLCGAGVANWGNGYPSSSSPDVYNMINGEWQGDIVQGMAANGRITVDPENVNFCVRELMLFDREQTYLYAVFSDIENAVVPGTVTRCALNAFEGCSALKSVSFSTSPERFPSFSECSSLEEIVIPEGIRAIEDHGFAHCTALKRVVIPESVTKIGSCAFRACTSLESISIPAGVVSIEEDAFLSCSSLTEIVIAEGNTAYEYKGNCLIEKATKTLIRGCDDSVIPSDGSVERIAEDAFSDCRKITSVIVPEGVTYIGDSAFANCYSLEAVVLPASLTEIGRFAFMNGYGNGVDVFYKGTQAEWEKIAIFDESLSRITVYFYSEEQPAEEGNFWHYVSDAPVKW